MGRKVFISFLGNSLYKDTVYRRLDGVLAPVTPFVQEVLFDEMCREWDDGNLIYVICTKGERGSYNVNFKEDATNSSLLKRLAGKPYFKCVQEPLLLEEGLEKDIWAIFSRIDELIKPEDSVYLDITNAFRSFPTFATTLLQYEKFRKNISISGIYYGLYAGPASADNAILDLSGIIQLQECVEMANGLAKYGRIADLADGIKEIEGFENVSETLKEFDQSWASIICDPIQKSAFKESLNEEFSAKISSSALPKPTIDLMQDVVCRLSGFTLDGGLENLLSASRWASNSDLLPQAYAFGKEYLNRKAAELLKNLNPIEADDPKLFLEFINCLLTMPNSDVKNGLFKGELANYRSTAKFILNLPWVKKFRKLYVTFNTGRNVILHAKTGYDYKRLRGIYNSYFEKCVNVLQTENIYEKQIVSNEELSPLFFNLSNHPSSAWNDTQLEAAGKYGTIVDLEFSMVDETMGEDYINDLVNKKIQEIKEMSADFSVPVTVHVMGEMTFTFAMVTELKKLGCRCVASTTKRMVEELADGTKKSKFEFCRFREY